MVPPNTPTASSTPGLAVILDSVLKGELSPSFIPASDDGDVLCSDIFLVELALASTPRPCPSFCPNRGCYKMYRSTEGESFQRLFKMEADFEFLVALWKHLQSYTCHMLQRQPEYMCQVETCQDAFNTFQQMLDHYRSHDRSTPVTRGSSLGHTVLQHELAREERKRRESVVVVGDSSSHFPTAYSSALPGSSNAFTPAPLSFVQAPYNLQSDRAVD